MASDSYNVTILPIAIAQGRGLFDKVAQDLGTSFEFVTYAASSESEPAFLGGSVEFLTNNVSSYAPAVLQNQDQIGVFNPSQMVGTVLSAAKKYEATIRDDLAGFDGKTWCQTGPVGISNAIVRVGVASGGLDLARQKVVSVGGVAGITPGLASGQCDIASGPVVAAAGQVDKGVGYIVRNYNDPAVAQEVIGLQASSILTTSNRFAERYQELTQAIVDASVQGLWFIQDNLDDPAAIYEALPDAAKEEYDAKTFENAFKLVSSGYDPRFIGGSVTPAMASDTLGFLTSLKVVPNATAVAPAKLWTNAFVNDAYKRLGPDAGTKAPDAPDTLDGSLPPPTVDFAFAG